MLVRPTLNGEKPVAINIIHNFGDEKADSLFPRKKNVSDN